MLFFNDSLYPLSALSDHVSTWLFHCGQWHFSITLFSFSQHLHKYVYFLCYDWDAHFKTKHVYLLDSGHVSILNDWLLDHPKLFMLACLKSGTQFLQASGNWTLGWNKLVEVHSSQHDALIVFFWFFPHAKQENSVLKLLPLKGVLCFVQAHSTIL